jgi:AP-2 complex subunit mu-1
MISAVVILDQTGDIILMKRYRSDFDLIALDNYRTGVIAGNDVTAPAVLIDETSFLHHYENELYYTAITRQNANACAIFEFLSKLPHIFSQVLDVKEINPVEIKKIVPEVFELLDEMVDSGYLQNTDPETLRLLTQRQSTLPASPNSEAQVTILATGAISWRPPNLFYRTNEFYVDVNEKLSVLASAGGKTLKSFASGNIMVKSLLSGMPDCSIGFLDQAVADDPLVDIDDIVFHQCVRLSEFTTARKITFTLPDGEFELMRYRKKKSLGIPILILPAVRDAPGNRLEIRIQVKTLYDTKVVAAQILLNIPLPPNTAEVDVNSTGGRGKYSPESNSVKWKGTSVAGKSLTDIAINVRCLPATSRATPATRLTDSITADFNIPNFSASGLSLKCMRITEKSGYKTERWLRYATSAGKYEIRMVD